MKKFLSLFNAAETKIKIQKTKQQQKKHYDKNAHDLTELGKGDQVTVQPTARTNIRNKQLTQKSLIYRRYMVELENRKRLMKNRR